MRRPTRQLAPLLVLAFATSGGWASKRPFNINDDLLAFPQYQVVFPKEYILHSQAEELLLSQTGPSPSDDSPSSQGQKSPQVYPGQGRAETVPQDSGKRQDGHPFSYEEMILDDRRLLCQIPLVTQNDLNTTTGAQADHKAEEQKELARATDRGLELLREMEGKCMYYYSGWWSYSFCYMKQIKQFHALPPGRGIPQYPPIEDTSTHSFILGRFPHSKDGDGDGEQDKHRLPKTDVAELHTKGGSRYLVQHLRGGTKCDLTGRDRQVEVQFHCHPQSTDHIGWIKELTTCSYLMVIYTPRLCDDVAFLPPQQDEVHAIECREILMPEEVSEWEAEKLFYLAHDLADAAAAESAPQIVGGIEVGGQTLVGMEGKKIEKGRVASAGEERVEVVAKREKGEVRYLSKQELKKYDLDQEKVEKMRKRLEELADGKDWKLEVVEANGELEYRGVVDRDDEVEEDGAQATAPQSIDQAASRESKTQQQQQQQEEEDDEDLQPPVEESTPAQQKSSDQDQPAVSREGSEETFKDEL